MIRLLTSAVSTSLLRMTSLAPIEVQSYCCSRTFPCKVIQLLVLYFWFIHIYRLRYRHASLSGCVDFFTARQCHCSRLFMHGVLSIRTEWIFAMIIHSMELCMRPRYVWSKINKFRFKASDASVQDITQNKLMILVKQSRTSERHFLQLITNCGPMQNNT
jgi:hypothetical protein